MNRVDVLGAMLDATNMLPDAYAAPLDEARDVVREVFEAAHNVIRKGSGGDDWTGHQDAYAARERLAAALEKVSK